MSNTAQTRNLTIAKKFCHFLESLGYTPTVSKINGWYFISVED